MSGKDKSISDANGESSSETENQDQKTVSYDSHKRLLDQRKKDQDELRAERVKTAALEAKFADEEKKKLEETGNFKKIAEDLQKKLEDKDKILSDLDKKVKNSQKMAAFKSKLPGDVAHKDFLGFVKLDSIQFDANGEIEESSLKSEVERFSSQYPEVIKRKVDSDLPNTKPGKQPSELTYDAWKKLPYDEQRKRMKEVKD